MDLILYELLKEKIAKMESEIERQKSLIEFFQRTLYDHKNSFHCEAFHERTLFDHVNSWHSSCDTN